MSYLSKVGLMFVVGAVVGATAAPMRAQNNEPNPYRTVPGVWVGLIILLLEGRRRLALLRGIENLVQRAAGV